MNTAWRVLVASGDPAVLHITSAVSDADFEIHDASDWPAVTELLATLRPELVIVGGPLDGTAAMNVLRAFRGAGEFGLLCVLPARGAAECVEALRLGADDCLPASATPDELVARMRAILRRIRQVPRRAVFRTGSVEIDPDSRLVRRGGRIVPMTRTEWLLLSALIDHAGKVVPARDLLERVWGPGYRDEREFLRVSIARLRKKLCPECATGACRAIRTYPSIGYMLRVEREWVDLPLTAAG